MPNCKTRSIPLLFIMISGVFFIFLTNAFSEEPFPNQLKKPLNQSLTIHQRSQKELDAWEKERIGLQAKYETLLKENKEMVEQRNGLIKEESNLVAMNESHERRITEGKRMSREIIPFLETVFERLNTWVGQDLPFLKKERRTRLDQLRSTLDASGISIAEKFRKVMETLFIEAAYGNTIEVYEEKVLMGDEERLGNIFRLGRVSLFFMTRDQSSSAYYSTSKKKWLPLSDRYLSVLQRAMEIGMKKRPAELLNFPIGRLHTK